MGLIAFIATLSSGLGGGVVVPPAFWVMATGFWDDDAVWDDDASWID